MGHLFTVDEMKIRHPHHFVDETDDARANAAIEDAEELIRYEGGLTPDDSSPERLTYLGKRVSMRIFVNPMSVVSESADNYSYRRIREGAVGNWLTDEEQEAVRAAVGLPSGKAGTTRTPYAHDLERDSQLIEIHRTWGYLPPTDAGW